MKPTALPQLDPRDAARLLDELRLRAPGYVPEWRPGDKGADAALLQAAARYAETIIRRLNQAPDKNLLAFLDVLGIQLVPAQPARAPLVMRLAENATDSRAAAGTRAAAPPPPERSDQVVFETERATGLAAGRLRQVLSLWPGRDQYIDHTEAFTAGQPFRPFRRRDLEDMPHHIYLAHDTLLALAGKGGVDLLVDLITSGNEQLDAIWEYWDGKVWREFLNMSPQCNEDEAGKIDGTRGWQRGGMIQLAADCAETAKTTVDGVEAFWIRGRLTEPLPLDPRQVLPEVESIRLKTDIQRPLGFVVAGPVVKPRDGCDVRVRVLNSSGMPMVDALVVVTDNDNNTLKGPKPEIGVWCFELSATDKTRVTIRAVTGATDSDDEEIPTDNKDVRILSPELTFDAKDRGSTYEVTITFTGLTLEHAFANQLPLDVSQTFYPLGPQPQPGSAFYFTNQEIFSKPGAEVQVLLQGASTSLGEISVKNETPVAGDPQMPSPDIAWEYWNGSDWKAIAITSRPSGTKNFILLMPKNLDSPFGAFGFVEFVIPDDMADLTINGIEALWMRARLVSGEFGFIKKIVSDNTTTYFPFYVPPALTDFRLGYTWQHGPSFPEHVRTYNDFRYEDHTEDNRWPGRPYQPFSHVRDVTPALYLGIDRKLPVDRLGILFDIEEVRGDTLGPALLWQYFDGFGWEDLAVEDETRRFRVPGLVSLIGPDDSAPFARFGGAALHWLRARLKEDGPPGAPTIRGIFPNAAWALQQQTFVDEPIGSSNGEPNQVFAMRVVPVLAGELILVRELGGMRANTEWRIVATEVLGAAGRSSVDIARIIADLEKRLAAEGPATEVQEGDLRLKRDRNKRVTEVWVRWQSRRHFGASGAGDRHYVVERARGRMLFGDGERGRVPPAGAAILAKLYRSGGGTAGNVEQGKVDQMLGPLGGIESVFNALAAGGGGDGEALARVAWRGPRSLRHRGRALAAADYEAMAFEANANVAVARALPCRNAAGHAAPGWVTLVIIPHTLDPRPWPSFGLREDIRAYVAERASADLAGAQHIFVTGPDYVAVEVEATIVPRDPAEAGEVERRARSALATFLHPLRGGPDGQGWPPGRAVYLSDVAAIAERVPGVDYVRELTLMLLGVPQGERVRVAADRIVVAGDIRLKLAQG